MGKPAKIFLVFLLLIAIVALGSLLGKKLYDRWGRTLTYPKDSIDTQYSGTGKITQFFEERILVVPRFSGRPYSDEGKPFFAEAAAKNQYPEDRYEISVIPAQEQLLYTVGKFIEWEDIEDSLDKYVIIELPSKEKEKYRASFEPSSLFGDNSTALAVEKVELWPNKETVNPVEKPENNDLNELTYEVLKNIIKKGDTVILTPLFDSLELTKKDEKGNYLAFWMILRRVGGVAALNKEITNLSLEK